MVRSEGLDTLRVALESVPFNTLFAESVLEKLVDGKLWFDREREPTLAHIIHPYGMTLLLALAPEPDFIALGAHIRWCRETIGTLWMQIHPQDLATEIDRVLDADVLPVDTTLHDASVQRFTRSNFTFVAERYALIRPPRPLPQGIGLRPMTTEDFALAGSAVSPRHFWRNADEFISHGGGWCVAQDREVISMAFTAVRLGSRLELGVETYPQHRGRGFSKCAAAAMIDQCIKSGIEPVWSCRKQNAPSYGLAQALGFLPTVEGPYYHLPRIENN